MSDQLPPPRRHRRNDATLPPTMKPGRENAEVFALQHGLFAAQVTMRHEDPAAFQEMRSVILTDYRPANHIELMMAEEVARSQWRMLRAHSMETALLDNRVMATAKQMKVDWEGRHRNINCDEGIAAALEKVDTKRFGLFLDYIRRAERSYYQAVRQIERTQAERRKRELHDAKMEEFLTRKLGRQQAMGSFGTHPIAEPAPGGAGPRARAGLSAPPSSFGNIPDA
jgi:hypothetical protein